MARIKISDLQPAGDEIFQASESFLKDLTEMDSVFVYGGEGNEFSQFLNFGGKTLEFALAGYAIYNIISVVKSFMASSSLD